MDPPAIAQLLGLSNWLISKVRVCSLDRARDAIDLVAATVDAPAGVVEHAIFGEDLAAYDAIIVGAGTRFGRLSSQMANFLDQAGGLWLRGALHGKVGGAFTSSATQHGGQETTLFSIITNLLHFGMVVVGLDYGHAGQMTLDEITGGSPYGATTITGGDGSRLPTANELEGARYQGRKIAETANKLHG